MAQWGISIGFAGTIMGICVAWRALPPVERRKYRWPFIISMVIIFFGVLMQLVAII